MSTIPPATNVDLELPETSDSVATSAGSDRRADIDAKQLVVRRLLTDVGADGLLVLDQVNLAWLTSGAVSRSIVDPRALPGLYFTAEQRWLLCSNDESQRMFDQEMNQMGFLLKEWPWHWGREQLLADLCAGRRVACDVPYRDCTCVAPQIAPLRRVLTPYERACLMRTGQILSHALEATCRTASKGDTERELAGQVAHRLYRRGAIPVMISVAADGGRRLYRHYGFTSAPVEHSCVIAATAKKYGLCVTASRTVSFGQPDEQERREFLTAAKLAGAFIASSWPDAGIRELLATGRRVLQATGFEHEETLSPQGHLVGRRPIEATLRPDSTETLKAGWPIAWTPSVGAAACWDTILVTDDGPQTVTPTEEWPLVSLHISGTKITVPHILIRE